MKSENRKIDITPSLLNQPGGSKTDFYPNSAYRSVMKKLPIKVTKPIGLVARYINAMAAYEALPSDENFKYLEAIKQEYKDYLALNK